MTKAEAALSQSIAEGRSFLTNYDVRELLND